MEDEWKILADYDERHILGQGSYGTVFKGKLVKKNGDGEVVDVAIKRLEKSKLNHQNDETKTKDTEFAIQKKLNHQNVVKHLHSEQDGDFFYFALELCVASLDKVFLSENDPEKYKGPLPTDIDFMLQLSLGLEYIHSENLVHRDIKPGNVLIFIKPTGETIMKWSDFGLSKDTSGEGEYSFSGKKGAEHYMAPEILVLRENDQQFKQEEIDGNAPKNKMKLTNMSDVFSCALVFFKYFAKGCHPFGNEEITSNIRESNLVNLKELPETHFASNSIKKMLSKKAEERPNLREIILLLNCLQKATRRNPDRTVDDVFQELNKKHEELCDLCSLSDLNEQQIAKLTQIVIEDTIGLINIVNQDGESPLQLACRNKKSIGLLNCVKVIASKERERIGDGQGLGSTMLLNTNYQNREDLNALHYVSVSYDGAQLHRLKSQMMNHHSLEIFRSPDSKNELEKYFLNVAHQCQVHTDGIDANNAVNGTTGRNRPTYVVDLIQFFVDNGMDMTTKTRGYATFLHVFCRFYIHDNLVDIVKLFIDNGVDVNAMDSEGWTALQILCRYYKHGNLINLAHLLIKNGADINVKLPKSELTLLHILCLHYPHKNLWELVKLLIDNGIDINAKETFGDGWTALQMICCRYPQDNLVDLIQLFIDKGADLNAETSSGLNAFRLLLLSQRNHPKIIELVRLLLEHGGNAAILTVNHDGETYLYHPLFFLFLPPPTERINNGNLIDLAQLLTPDGWTILHSFCRCYRHQNLPSLLRLLIEKGVDINAQISSNGNTALHLLCRYYCHDDLILSICFLIENGANVNLKAFKGITALHILCVFYAHNSLPSLLQLLIEKDVDINAKTSLERYTALHLLCRFYHHDNLIDSVQLLIGKGANVNARDFNGMTALHILCVIYTHKNLIDLVKLLIDRGAEVNAKDSRHEVTAVYLLCQEYSHDNLFELLRLLIDNGADVTEKQTGDGATPLHLLFANKAQRKNLSRIIRFLIDKGIDVTVRSSYGITAFDYLRHIICNTSGGDHHEEIDSELVELFKNHENSHGNLIDLVLLLTSNGIKVDLIESEGVATLYFPYGNYSNNNLVDLIQFLIDEKDFDIKSKTYDGWTSLHFLCRYYCDEKLVDIFKWMIIKGVDLTVKLPDGRNVLHLLCQYYRHRNLIDVIRIFIDNSFDVSGQYGDGWNALILLCRYYNHDDLIGMIRLLINKGVDINEKTSGDWTALHFLCKYYPHQNLIEIIQLLIENGVVINAKTTVLVDGDATALHFLCHHYKHDNLIDLIHLLIDNGADVNGNAFNKGWTPLHVLCISHPQKKLIELVKCLLTKGADVNAKNSKGLTTLMILCISYTMDNLIDLVQLLIDYGADVNAKYVKKSFNALHFLCQNKAQRNNLTKVVQLLVRKGIDVTLKNSKQRTALDLLRKNPWSKNEEMDPNLVQLLTGEDNEHASKYLNNYSARLLADDGVDVSPNEFEGMLVSFQIMCNNTEREELGNLVNKLQSMISQGSLDINEKNSDGITTLHAFIQMYPHDNLIDLVRFLIVDKGADATATTSNGSTALYVLCSAYTHDNLIDVARLLMDNGVDINANTITDGMTALDLLCVRYKYENLINLVQLFIDRGVDLSAATCNINGFNKLHLLCLNEAAFRHSNNNNVLRIMDLLISNGIDVNQQASCGMTALNVLCHQHYSHDNLLELAQLLIRKGADVTIKGSYNCRALHLLIGALNGRIDYLRLVHGSCLLSEEGTHVNARTQSDGRTALHYLCQRYTKYNLIELIRLFMENGVDVINCSDSNGYTALHEVCQYYPHTNLIDILRLFIENSADLKAKSSDGWTALHLVCRYCKHENLIHILRLFIENGADMKSKIFDGCTAFHLVCLFYNYDNLNQIVRLFIENDSSLDVTLKVASGTTALHFLCQNYKHDNLIDLVQLFIGKEVDINAKDPDGRTALYCVCRFYIHRDVIDLVQLLINNGADVNNRDTDGLTALYFLCRSYTHDNLIDIVQLLIDNGADVNVKDSKGLTALNYVAENCLRHDCLRDVIKLLRLTKDN